MYPKAEYKVTFSYKGQEQCYNTIVPYDTRKKTEENAFHNAVIQLIKKLGFSTALVKILKKEIRESGPISVKIVTTKT